MPQAFLIHPGHLSLLEVPGVQNQGILVDPCLLDYQGYLGPLGTLVLLSLEESPVKNSVVVSLMAIRSDQNNLTDNIRHLQMLLSVQEVQVVHHARVDHPDQADPAVRESQCHPCLLLLHLLRWRLLGLPSLQRIQVHLEDQGHPEE